MRKRKILQGLICVSSLISPLFFLSACNPTQKELEKPNPEPDPAPLPPAVNDPGKNNDSENEKNTNPLDTNPGSKEQEEKKSDTVTPPPSKSQQETPKKEEPAKPVNKNQQQYEQLLTEVQIFLKDELKSELKYELYRDSLNQIIDDTNYYLVTNHPVNSEDLYKQQYNKLSLSFNEAKSKYKSAPEVSYTESDLQHTEGKGKSEDLLSLNYSNQVPANAKINLEAMSYLKFLSAEQIKRYYDDNDPALIKQLGKDGISKNRKIIDDKVKDITKGKDKKMDQVKAVFDWLTANLKYAQGADQTASIDPVEAMNKLIVVCGGFSNLYKAMLDSLNVQSAVVIGWSKYGYHQWNIVFDEDKKEFFHSDATWGQGYYAKTNDDFAKDHRSFEILNSPYVKDGFEYKYYRGFALNGNKNKNADQNQKHADNINDLKVTSISSQALKESKKLYIGEHIEQIDYAGGTGEVVEFTVNPHNKHFSAKDGILYNKEMTKLLVIPNKLTNKEFTLPKTVREIQDWKQSFNNPYLEKINVEPGSYWFASYGGILYTNNFERLVFVPNNIGPTVTVHKNANFKEHTFAQLKNISEIIIPEGVTRLPQWFVNSVTSLRKIYLPSSLTELKEDSLWNVSNLTVKVQDKMNQSVLNILKKKGFKIEK